MVNVFGDFLTSFLLGLLTPITAVCVLPLYPGFLAYLSNQVNKDSSRYSFLKFGLLIVSGVILFMLLLGLIFTTFLKFSLTKVIGIISPIAFIVLIIISLLLIFNVDLSKYMPKAKIPLTKKPYLSAFVYGFFFGAIVIPCNPLFIAALFTKAITGTSFLINLLDFLFFGIGIGFPLLLLSIISTAASTQIIKFLTEYKRAINLLAGIIMLIISLYYLMYVFRIFG